MDRLELLPERDDLTYCKSLTRLLTKALRQTGTSIMRLSSEAAVSRGTESVADCAYSVSAVPEENRLPAEGK